VGDEYLIYVTGGLAGSNVRLQPRAVSQPREDAKFRTGWVVGIGVTAPINDRWTWGIEYLYADFGTEDRPNDSTSDLQQQLRFSTGRLSVNYKF